MSLAYAEIGAQVRSSARQQVTGRELSSIVTRVKRSCELLDLSALGIKGNLHAGHLGEAQLRSDAVAEAAEELLALTQLLSRRIREARLDRTVAA